MRVRYRGDPPFSEVARKVRVLPYAYRRHVWGLGMVAVGRHIVLRAKRRAPVSKTGVNRGALKKSLRARRVDGTWPGGRRVPKGSAIVFSLAKYARYVEGARLAGESAPAADPQPYLIPAIEQDQSGQLRVFQRAVGTHFLRTSRQIGSGRISAATARLIRGV